jgi:hypothetical protein
MTFSRAVGGRKERRHEPPPRVSPVARLRLERRRRDLMMEPEAASSTATRAELADIEGQLAEIQATIDRHAARQQAARTRAGIRLAGEKSQGG